MKCQCDFDQAYDVVGLCDICKVHAGDEWTEISVPKVVCIPKFKPDVEQIDKILAKVSVTSKRIIKTPKGSKNAEGQTLTGRKLLLDGDICLTVIYTADEPTQSVHTAHFCIPFSTYIVIECDADYLDSYCVTPCIEDIYAKVFNCRDLFINTTLFIKAERFKTINC